MALNRLIKTDALDIKGQTYEVRYFETQTLRGTRRYRAELVLGLADRIIMDGSSLIDLESKMARVVPATIYSRLLAARAA